MRRQLYLPTIQSQADMLVHIMLVLFWA